MERQLYPQVDFCNFLQLRKLSWATRKAVAGRLLCRPGVYYAKHEAKQNVRINNCFPKNNHITVDVLSIYKLVKSSDQ